MKAYLWVVVWFACTCKTNNLYADLLFATDGGQEVFSEQLQLLGDGDPLDDVVTLRSLGLADFRLFGQNVTQLWVSDNGNLNSTGSSSFFAEPLATLTPARAMIAPMWDDFFIAKLPDSYSPNNRVIERNLPGVWYSVTWEHVRLYNELVVGGDFIDTQRSIQAVIFGDDFQYEGFQFLHNDIVFSYVSHTATTSDFVDPALEASLPTGFSQLNAAIGITGAAGEAVSMFGDSSANGIFEADEASSALPWTDRQFILFREISDQNGQFDHYAVSTESLSSVPEPLLPLPLVFLCLLTVHARAISTKE
ncbi:MAG: hypothetical protein KDB03_27275 [Planctomycetales bacterium]|nr:hypothetical protein [Planctomycetales bacterium]